MKIPDPIIPPMTIIAASNGPSLRASPLAALRLVLCCSVSIGWVSLRVLCAFSVSAMRAFAEDSPQETRRTPGTRREVLGEFYLEPDRLPPGVYLILELAFLGEGA